MRIGQAAKVLTVRQILILGLSGAVVGFLSLGALLALPDKQRSAELEQEKAYWAQVLAGQSPDMYEALSPVEPQIGEIPTIEQIPYLIDRCSNLLVAAGVEVTSFNVERFAEKETDGSPLDYALLRIYLIGSWPEIEAGLKKLETSNLAVRVEELHLDANGGDALLKIYFQG